MVTGAETRVVTEAAQQPSALWVNAVDVRD